MKYMITNSQYTKIWENKKWLRKCGIHGTWRGDFVSQDTAATQHFFG